MYFSVDDQRVISARLCLAISWPYWLNQPHTNSIQCHLYNRKRPYKPPSAIYTAEYVITKSHTVPPMLENRSSVRQCHLYNKKGHHKVIHNTTYTAENGITNSQYNLYRWIGHNKVIHSTIYTAESLIT